MNKYNIGDKVLTISGKIVTIKSVETYYKTTDSIFYEMEILDFAPKNKKKVFNIEKLFDKRIKEGYTKAKILDIFINQDWPKEFEGKTVEELLEIGEDYTNEPDLFVEVDDE